MKLLLKYFSAVLLCCVLVWLKAPEKSIYDQSRKTLAAPGQAARDTAGILLPPADSGHGKDRHCVLPKRTI